MPKTTGATGCSATREPGECPQCGRPGVPVLYGMPTPDAVEAADRGEIALGGCVIEDDHATHVCLADDHRWRELHQRASGARSPHRSLPSHDGRHRRPGTRDAPRWCETGPGAEDNVVVGKYAEALVAVSSRWRASTSRLGGLGCHRAGQAADSSEVKHGMGLRSGGPSSRRCWPLGWLPADQEVGLRSQRLGVGGEVARRRMDPRPHVSGQDVFDSAAWSFGVLCCDLLIERGTAVDWPEGIGCPEDPVGRGSRPPSGLRRLSAAGVVTTRAYRSVHWLKTLMPDRTCELKESNCSPPLRRIRPSAT